MAHQEYIVRVYDNGDKEWHQNGLLHRLYGPAIELASGTKYWYQNGKLHRLDGPAVECANGDKSWYQNGRLHRLDGPAIEYANGGKYWYQNGKFHRLDGSLPNRNTQHVLWSLRAYTKNTLLWFFDSDDKH